jgi:DNA-binding MarR family transcriptional regulator
MATKEVLSRLLGSLHRSAKNYFHREFSNTELSGGAHVFLMLLLHEDGLTQHELSARLNFDKAHTTRAIQRLIESGFISRQRDANDQRAYRIFLTEKAKQIEPEIRRILLKWSDVISTGFSEAELQLLVNLLGRLNENAQEILGPGKV